MSYVCGCGIDRQRDLQLLIWVVYSVKLDYIEYVSHLQLVYDNSLDDISRIMVWDSWSQKAFCSLFKTWMWREILNISYRRDLPQNMRYGHNQGFQKGGRDSGRWPDTILVVRAARPLWESPLRQTEQGNVRGGVYDGNACLKWKVEACLQIPILRDRVLTIDALMSPPWFSSSLEPVPLSRCQNGFSSFLSFRSSDESHQRLNSGDEAWRIMIPSRVVSW